VKIQKQTQIPMLYFVCITQKEIRKILNLPRNYAASPSPSTHGLMGIYKSILQSMLGI
jgi:hypothetical protein